MHCGSNKYHETGRLSNNDYLVPISVTKLTKVLPWNSRALYLFFLKGESGYLTYFSESKKLWLHLSYVSRDKNKTLFS